MRQILITSGSTVEIFNETQAATNADLNINVKQGMDSARSATSSSTRATWINLIVMLIIIALCAVIGLILNREIVPRIESLKIAVEAMAAKDLTASVQVTGTDEMGRMGEAFNTSMATVREVLVSVAQEPRRSPRQRRRSARARCRAPATRAPNRARPTRLPPQHRR